MVYCGDPCLSNYNIWILLPNSDIASDIKRFYLTCPLIFNVAPNVVLSQKEGFRVLGGKRNRKEIE